MSMYIAEQYRSWAVNSRIKNKKIMYARLLRWQIVFRGGKQFNRLAEYEDTGLSCEVAGGTGEA